MSALNSSSNVLSPIASQPIISVQSAVFGGLIGNVLDQNRYIRLYTKHKSTVIQNLMMISNDPETLFDDIMTEFSEYDSGIGGGIGGGGGDIGGNGLLGG